MLHTARRAIQGTLRLVRFCGGVGETRNQMLGRSWPQLLRQFGDQLISDVHCKYFPPAFTFLRLA